MHEDGGSTRHGVKLDTITDLSLLDSHTPSRKSDRKPAGPKRRSHSHPNTYIRMERGAKPPKPNNATKKADARSDRNPTDARPSITLGLSYGKQTILPIIHHANNE